MSKWKNVRLGEVATIVSGSTPKTSVDEYWNGKYNWITPAEIKDTSIVITDTERKITEKAIKDTNLKVLPIGTVLLSSRAPIGKVAIAGVEMYCNQGFKNLICSDKIHNKYVFWFLKGKTEFLNSLGRGATFKEISKTIVERIEIPLPPLEIQKHIAHTLDTAAELLALRKKQLAELDNLIKSTFYEMFGDPVTNEKGWEKRTLSDYINKERGISYGIVQRGDHVEGGIPVVRIRDIIDGRFLESELVRTSSEISNKYARTILQGGEILLSIRGTIGKVAISPLHSKGWNISREVAILPIVGDINTLFLLYLLKSDEIQNIFQSMVKGIAQSGMNLADIRLLEIIYPPLSLQNQFTSIVSKIEEQKALVRKAIDETQLLFDSLMSEYFD